MGTQPGRPPPLSTFGTPISKRLLKEGAEPACTDTTAVRRPRAPPLPGEGQEGDGCPARCRAYRGPPGGSRGKGSAARQRGGAGAAAGRRGAAAGSGRGRRGVPRPVPTSKRPWSCVGASSLGQEGTGAWVPGGGKGSRLTSSSVCSFAAPKLVLKSSHLPSPPPQVGCADQSH